MIFIYDLILNWDDKNNYVFFEWNDDDEIEYIKRMPVFKIKNIDKIFDNDVKINLDFLKCIYNKTEVYTSRNTETVEYACIFVSDDLNKSIAIEFSSDGRSLYRSSIHVLDMEDLYELGEKIGITDIDVKILGNRKDNDYYLTRIEKEKKKVLVNEITNAYKSNNIDKLKYIYYEIFGSYEKDILTMKNKLLDSLNNNFLDAHNNIYNLIKIPN